MGDKLFTILLFMKRRPGMSREQFMQYYEEKHVPLAVKYASGMRAYKRRFITPHTHYETGECSELEFDVITEICFDDEKIFKGALGQLANSPMPDDIIADEKNLFDRSTFRVATCTEFVTKL